MDDRDLIIDARWIVPVVPTDRVLEHHAVLVRAGRITDILPREQAARDFPEASRVHRPNHVLIPGLVNAHTHAAMALLRGLADDMPLHRWLTEHIWPAEGRWVGAEMVRDGTELAIAEMIRGGTTCFNDMYFFPDVVARTTIDHGLRAVIGMIVIETATAWAPDAATCLEKGLAVHDRFRGSELVTTAFAPHAPYSVAPANLERIRVLANELDAQIHMHVHETEHEVSEAVAKTGVRPLAALDELGLVTPALAAVHMTQLNDAEIERLAASGASVIHCPESNLKLASGFCPVARLLAAGVNVALGTDGAASNNDLDMFGEMRTAALLGKGVSGDAAAVSATRVLEMATINGARALGLGDVTGSVEPGKWADLACVDLGRPATQPVYNPVSQLVYACSREQVTDTWVAGAALLADGRSVNGDDTELIRRADAWRERIATEDAAAQET